MCFEIFTSTSKYKKDNTTKFKLLGTGYSFIALFMVLQVQFRCFEGKNVNIIVFARAARKFFWVLPILETNLSKNSTVISMIS